MLWREVRRSTESWHTSFHASHRSRFEGEELDGTGLSLLTLGNLGIANVTLGNSEGPNGTASAVVQESEVTGFGWSFSVAQAANIITLTDLTYSLVRPAYGISLCKASPPAPLAPAPRSSSSPSCCGGCGACTTLTES